MESAGAFDAISPDLACVVLSHVENLKDRFSLARVNRAFFEASKRDASLPPPDVLFQFSRESDIAGQHEREVAWLKKAAARDQVEALALLGAYYGEGMHGVEIDDAAAFRLCKRATELDHEGSELYRISIGHLGECYVEGNGVEQDIAKGVELVRKAADLGEIESMLSMASYHSEGTHGKVARLQSGYINLIKTPEDLARLCAIFRSAGAHVDFDLDNQLVAIGLDNRLITIGITSSPG
jgi:hypothetical protein